MKMALALGWVLVGRGAPRSCTGHRRARNRSCTQLPAHLLPLEAPWPPYSAGPALPTQLRLLAAWPHSHLPHTHLCMCLSPSPTPICHC